MAEFLTKQKETDYVNRLGEKLYGLRGSEAGAALGVDKHMSRLELWARKTGNCDSPEKTDSERKRLSQDMDPYIAERFSEVTGKQLRVPGSVYRHEKFDFLIADTKHEIIGENAALECCMVNSALEKMHENPDELPQSLLARCYHQLAVTNFEKIYLALLDLFTGGLGILEIPFDKEKCRGLVNAEVQFWNEFVIPKKPPQPDGSDSAEEALKRLPKPVRGSETDLENYSETIRELYEIREMIKENEARERQLRQEIILLMGENSVGFTEEFRVDYSRQNRKIVDPKLLKENHAEIYAACLKNSAANILKISEIN